MGNLVRKDIRVHWKVGLVLLVWGLLFLVYLGTNSPAGLSIGYYIPLFFTVLLASSEYKNRNLLFVGSLPVTRRDIVGGKYLLSLLTCVLGAAVSASFSGMHAAGGQFSGMEIWLGLILIVFSLAVFTISLYLPFAFWLGEKAMLVVSICTSLLFILLVSSFKDLSSWLMGSGSQAAMGDFGARLLHFPGMLLLPALSLLAMLASRWISVRILEGKDLG